MPIASPYFGPVDFDPNDPLNRGLSFYAPAWPENRGGHWTDVVTGGMSSPESSSSTLATAGTLKVDSLPGLAPDWSDASNAHERWNSHAFHDTYRSVANQEQWSYSCWINSGDITLNQNQYMLMAGEGTAGDWVIVKNQNDVTIFMTMGSFVSTPMSNSLGQSDTWYHIGFSADGPAVGSPGNTSIRYYLNGELYSTPTIFGSGNRVGDTTGSISIGNRDDLARQLDGAIVETRLYNRILGDSEFAEIYRRIRDRQKPRRRYYFPAEVAAPVDPTAYRLRRKATARTEDWSNPLNRDLVAWYQFRQKGGSKLIDTMGSGVEPAMDGSTDQGNWVPGPDPMRRSLRFGDNSSERLTTTSTHSLGTQYSVSCFVKYHFSISDTGGFVVVQQVDRDNSNVWDFQMLRSGNQWKFWVNNAGNEAYAQDTTDPRSINRDKWWHLLGVRDGDDVHLYVDGVKAGTEQQGMSLGTIGGMDAFDVGCQSLTATPLWTSPWDGDISEIRIYDRVLTQADAVKLSSMMHNGEGYLRSDNIVLSSAEPPAVTFSPYWASRATQIIQPAHIGGF